MLEYKKDGKRVKVTPISDKGYIGQIVVLDHVTYDKDHELSKYSQPYAFTIVEKIPGESGYYVMKDQDGVEIIVKDTYKGASEIYMYDLHEWLIWNSQNTKSKLGKKDDKIKKLEDHLDLLKRILTDQGFRVISETQAKKLGID